MRSPMAARSSGHAMKVPVLIWTGAHPGRPVLLQRNGQRSETIFSTNRSSESFALPTNRWWLVTIGS